MNYFYILNIYRGRFTTAFNHVILRNLLVSSPVKLRENTRKKFAGSAHAAFLSPFTFLFAAFFHMNSVKTNREMIKAIRKKSFLMYRKGLHNH